MLKSVETVTGGASAAYGTDAVSGVVNFILDTDFEGFDGHAQTGHTLRGDGDNNEFSLAFGTKVGSRAHLLLSAEHTEQDAVETFAGTRLVRGLGRVAARWRHEPERSAHGACVSSRVDGGVVRRRRRVVEQPCRRGDTRGESAGRLWPIGLQQRTAR